MLPYIAELKGSYPILVLVTTKDEEAIKSFAEARRSELLDIELRREAPDIRRLYDYLHAADAFLFNKRSLPRVVVSSAIAQCLGSGCPIVARESNFVEIFDEEVMKYSTPEELKRHLINIFDEAAEHKRTLESAKRYVERNSASVVAEKYIELFNMLRGEH
jgi:glycosyltransferase involved in cell wall biosynthesis